MSIREDRRLIKSLVLRVLTEHVDRLHDRLDQSADGHLADAIALSAWEDRLGVLPGTGSILSELASGLLVEIDVGILFRSFLDSPREEQLWQVGIEIEVVPVDRNQLAYPEARVSQQRGMIVTVRR